MDGVKIFSAKVLFLACLNYLDQFFIAESDSNLCDCNWGYRWGQRERNCVTCSRVGRRAASWGGGCRGATRSSIWFLDRIRCSNQLCSSSQVFLLHYFVLVQGKIGKQLLFFC